LQEGVRGTLSAKAQTAEQVAMAIASDAVETVYFVLEHLSANGKARLVTDGTPPQRTFAAV